MSAKRKQNSPPSNYRCVYCDDDLNAKEELVALIEPKFSVIEGSDYGDLNLQITDFIVHDQSGPCSLDQGLIEAGEPVYVCGRLLNICVGDNDCDETVAAKMIGPVNEWWFSGFDGSSTLLVGIESPYSSYLLQNPHLEYANVFEKLKSKMFLTKFVIEILQQNPDINFAGLISMLRDKSPQYDNEFLVSNINFLIDHIENYDSCRDSDEIHLCETKIFKTFHDIRKGSNVSSMSHLRIDQPVECSFGLSGVNTENSKKIFNQLWNNIFDNHSATNFSANVSNLNVIERGRFVKFETDGHRQSFGRIISTDPDRRSCHIDLLVPGKDTLLGKTSSKNLLFAVEKCLDIDLPSSKVEVIEVELQTSLDNDCRNAAETGRWICWQIYDAQRCCFKSIPSNYLQECDTISCLGCLKSKFAEETKPEYSLGDCVLISSQEIRIPVNNYFENTLDDHHQIYDSNVYPEKFRKQTFTGRSDNYETEDLASGYSIGYIDGITMGDNDRKYFELKLFYKPENIFKKYEDFIKCDPNLLFWSNKHVQVDASLAIRKCKVIYSENVSNSLDIEEFFYFNQCYDPDTGEFTEPTQMLKSKFNHASDGEIRFDRNLTILDLFSGCGGLSFGFAPLASRLYAIEKEKSAAQTYRMNFKDSIVFNADANSLLKTLIDSKDGFLNAHLPPSDSIDMIISGPPCQGFTEMNRFSSSEYSLFKRSFVGCFLNYLDFYRPKYFLFENVSNIIHYGKSLLFQTICSFMIHSGYQIRIAILQAGCYGLPQNRRRLFILGSRNSLPLPEFPLPTHLFAANKSRTSFKIGSMKFDPFDNRKGALRMVTIEDAIGDLPELNQQDYFLDIPREYNHRGNLTNHYQKLLGCSATHQVVRDHCCRTISQLNLERIKRIPLEVGSDWRDLPNLEIQLENGKLVKKLKYSARAKSSGKPNKQNDRNTLIPRCLAHTANRNNHWKGVFGRLSWRGYFPTIVTNPDPISAQGKTIHPSQHRVISIREMARSQGFPDSYIFFGTKTERYSQIGNAVPPILSRKLAREFIKSTK